ncbi:hypothetical protein H6G17_05965 [Chroococcidiopsis sp. FACHB-1243]|uniref:hypothetical protein n=1 Tax=Chroococcidiopsis sp. [FACHB-1243] TaxID=2692781 RepID=UPI00177E048D|nr:hypothetical protein [Chroococcidiopsis sp. [FACHB-1243]]MBD2305059.1 hypothetical protein [Chroococcidiopsis sp. [FACHB-1243]]
MKQGINTNKLPHAHRVIRHENYNKAVPKEVLAAADRAILIMRLKDALKHEKFVPVGIITALSDKDYEELSGLVDALIGKGLIVYRG